ncbi:hypothetical protein LAZ67_16000086, partial [Cordylochernes scorpioides]
MGGHLLLGCCRVLSAGLWTERYGRPSASRVLSCVVCRLVDRKVWEAIASSMLSCVVCRLVDRKVWVAIVSRGRQGTSPDSLWTVNHLVNIFVAKSIWRRLLKEQQLSGLKGLKMGRARTPLVDDQK